MSCYEYNALGRPSTGSCGDRHDHQQAGVYEAVISQECFSGAILVAGCHRKAGLI